MAGSCRKRPEMRAILLVGLGSVAWIALGLEVAHGQDFQTRLPSFQSPGSQSLEAQILDRLSVTGQYEPGDLASLARLAVLESISMLVNVRNDRPNGMLDSGMEAAVTALWDQAEDFYENVSESPLDAATLPRAQFLFAQMMAAQRQVESTLGAFPALSPRAATRLQEVSRVSGAISSVMTMTEANVSRTLPIPPDRTLDLEAIRRQSQLLANDLVVLIEKLKADDPEGKRRHPVQEDLTGMLALVQDFEQKLALEPPLRELQASYRQSRRRLWQIEAEIARLGWPAGLRLEWRRVPQAPNAISEAFGLPRVIELAPNPRPAAASNRKLAAQVDRAVAWVDEFLTALGPELRKTPAGTRFQADTARMRRQLLKLRRSAIANDPPDRLSQSVREIEALNQQLVDRAGEVAGDVQGKDLIARLRDPALAVNRLRGLIAER